MVEDHQASEKRERGVKGQHSQTFENDPDRIRTAADRGEQSMQDGQD